MNGMQAELRGEATQCRRSERGCEVRSRCGAGGWADRATWPLTKCPRARAPLPRNSATSAPSWSGALSVARIVPVVPVGPDSLAGALEVLINLIADANSPDRGEPVFGPERAHVDGDLPGAHARALHGLGFEVDVMDGLRVHAKTSVITAAVT